MSGVIGIIIGTMSNNLAMATTLIIELIHRRRLWDITGRQQSITTFLRCVGLFINNPSKCRVAIEITGEVGNHERENSIDGYFDRIDNAERLRGLRALC